MQTPRTLLAALLLLGLLSGFGCTSASGPDSPETLTEAMHDEAVATDPLFWRVEPRGGATLHLLGSLHLGPPQGWRYPQTINGAWADSGTLIVEADDRNVTQASMAPLAQRYMVIGEAATLEDLVPSETLRDLALYLEGRGGNIEGLMKTRPWMIATVISLASIAELGFSPESGVDHGYLLEAGEREVVELESIEAQLQIFGDLAPDLEALYLQQALDDIDEGKAIIVNMVEAWQSGDEHTLEALITEAFGDAPEFDELNRSLLADRNVAMARRLDRFARDPDRAGHSVFVVIGAAHFVGDGNIRQILEREYDLRIEQIDSTVPPAPTHRN